MRNFLVMVGAIVLPLVLLGLLIVWTEKGSDVYQRAPGTPKASFGAQLPAAETTRPKSPTQVQIEKLRQENLRRQALLKHQDMLRQKGMTQAEYERAQLKEDVAARPRRCRPNDADCWAGSEGYGLLQNCERQVESAAKYQFEWTDGYLDAKFLFVGLEGDLSVRAVGDKIKFQNGFGAWQVMVYDCVIDLEASRAVATVKARG